MKRWKSGSVGWLILTSFVAIWDFEVSARRGGETLSTAFGRAAKHPIYRWPVSVAWVVTTLHIFGVLTPSIDPFIRVSSFISKRSS